ncbi:MAG: hypothetical protein GY850_25355 [bacterium]|nr:hypothetical protein [bacterium]
MTEESFTEVTSESWFSRIGGAIKGIVIGLVLFIAAFPILFWNEGRAVKRYKTLNEGAGSVISLAEASVLPDYEGELVHVAGKAVTDEIVADTEFDVAVNAIKLKRKVEMYQWKETKKSKTQKKLGGGKKTVTSYSYSETWSPNLINSSNFKKPSGHYNPDSMPYQSREFVAAEVSLGEFRLSRSLVSEITRTTPLPVADLANIEGISNASYHGNGIYIGNTPSSPQIGDIRITYRIVTPTDVSVVSKQMGNSFVAYRAEAGGTIDMLKIGIVGADLMFQQAQRSNVMWTWVFRVGGFILMLVGVAMILAPLSVAADVIPFLGSIVGAGTGILSFLIATPFAFLTVAVAWLRYRPVIGISLLVLSAIIAGFIFVMSKRGKTSGKINQATPRSNKKINRKGLKSDRVEQRPCAQSKQTVPKDIDDDGIEMAPPPVKVQAIQKNAEEMFNKGQKFFRTGQYDKAVMQFTQVLKSGGNKKLALYNRGVALFKLNKKDAALKDFNYAAKLGHEKAKAILNQVKNSSPSARA